jgi:hypothetical protein
VRCQLKLEAVEFMPIPEYKYKLDLVKISLNLNRSQRTVQIAQNHFVVGKAIPCMHDILFQRRCLLVPIIWITIFS